LTPTPGRPRPAAPAAGDGPRDDEEPGKRAPAALDGPDGLLTRARRGDGAARETLIDRYAPFALKVASQVTGGYVELGRHDEASVALIALNESIDRYDPGRGSNFLGFAREVIRRRLIDLYRRNRSRWREIPAGSLAEGEFATDPAGGGQAGGGWGIEATQLVEAERLHQEMEETDERQEEVFRYREALAAYGITLDELVEFCPRHEDARRRAIEVARILASRPDMVQHLRRTGELPLKALSALTPVSRKTIERQRKYIIAIVVILTEDLPHLKEYLR